MGAERASEIRSCHLNSIDDITNGISNGIGNSIVRNNSIPNDIVKPNANNIIPHPYTGPFKLI